MLYCGQLFSTFAWHVEDHCMCDAPAVLSCFRDALVWCGLVGWCAGRPAARCMAALLAVLVPFFFLSPFFPFFSPHRFSINYQHLGAAKTWWALVLCESRPPCRRACSVHCYRLPGVQGSVASCLQDGAAWCNLAQRWPGGPHLAPSSPCALCCPHAGMASPPAMQMDLRAWHGSTRTARQWSRWGGRVPARQRCGLL